MQQPFASPMRSICKACGAAFTIFMTLTLSVWVQNLTANQGKNVPISVSSRSTPLVDVLNSVSKTSGYQFILAEDWKNTPISVNFDQLPLEDALHRILTNLNHVLIYDSGNTIRINIYGVSAPIRSGTSSPSRKTMPRPDMTDLHENDQNPDREPEIQTPDRSAEDEPTTTDESAPAPPETPEPRTAQKAADGEKP